MRCGGLSACFGCCTCVAGAADWLVFAAFRRRRPRRVTVPGACTTARARDQAVHGGRRKSPCTNAAFDGITVQRAAKIAKLNRALRFPSLGEFKALVLNSLAMELHAHHHRVPAKVV